MGMGTEETTLRTENVLRKPGENAIPTNSGDMVCAGLAAIVRLMLLSYSFWTSRLAVVADTRDRPSLLQEVREAKVLDEAKGCAANTRNSAYSGSRSWRSGC